MFLEGHVEIVIAEKLENLLGVFGGLATKAFVGVYRAVQKPYHGLKARIWAWVAPTWQLSGCRDVHYDLVVGECTAKEKLVKQATTVHQCANTSCLPSLGCMKFAFFKVRLFGLNTPTGLYYSCPSFDIKLWQITMGAWQLPESQSVSVWFYFWQTNK